MKLQTREDERGVIVEVHQKLIGDPKNSEMFHSLFKSLLQDDKKKIVVSLRHTTLVNSQGLGMLIGSYTSVKNAGGVLVLAEVATERVRNILTVTDLVRVFDIFDSIDDALNYLKEQHV